MVQRRAYVLGGSITPFIGKGSPEFIWKRHPDFGVRENPTLEEYISKSVKDALAATGVPAASIDKAYIGNFIGELFSSQGHLGAALIGADPALHNKPSVRVEEPAPVADLPSHAPWMPSELVPISYWLLVQRFKPRHPHELAEITSPVLPTMPGKEVSTILPFLRSSLSEQKHTLKPFQRSRMRTSHAFL
jgi:hypothetical protein